MPCMRRVNSNEQKRNIGQQPEVGNARVFVYKALVPGHALHEKGFHRTVALPGAPTQPNRCMSGFWIRQVIM